MFLAGILEAWSVGDTPQEISPATLSTINVQTNAFMNALDKDFDGVGPDYSSEMVVVHRPVVGAASWSKVTGLVCRSALTHQVRRK